VMRLKLEQKVRDMEDVTEVQHISQADE
jgi:hypothetical protein